MARQNINISTANSGSGDTLRDAFDKTNDNFVDLYSGARKSSTLTTNGATIADSDGVVFLSSSSSNTYTLIDGTIGDTKIVTNIGSQTATLSGNFRSGSTTAISTGNTIILIFDGTKWNVK